MPDKLADRQLTTIALFMIGTVVCMVMFLVDWSWIDKRDYAAWVQAVGSVAAIAVAIWVPAHHRLVQERDAAAAAFIGVTKLILEVLVALQVRKQRIQELAAGGPCVPPINDVVLADWLIRLRAVDHILVRPATLGVRKIALRQQFGVLNRLVTREGRPEDVALIEGLDHGLSQLQAPMTEIALQFGAAPNSF